MGYIYIYICIHIYIHIYIQCYSDTAVGSTQSSLLPVQVFFGAGDLGLSTWVIKEISGHDSLW